MKYYTKEWYNLCQQCGYHYDLRISDKAAVFSDKYYQTLYKRKINEFLRSAKRRSELTADDIYGIDSGRDDFIIELDSSGGFTNIDKVIFKNYSILEKQGDLQGAVWLYQEIYPNNVGNEYHALVIRNDGELAYLTVVASDIEFKRQNNHL